MADLSMSASLHLVRECIGARGRMARWVLFISIDKQCSMWLNNGAGWKHCAPGGVPELIIKFKAVWYWLPDGLNVFLTCRTGLPIITLPLLRHGAVGGGILL